MISRKKTRRRIRRVASRLAFMSEKARESLRDNHTVKEEDEEATKGEEALLFPSSEPANNDNDEDIEIGHTFNSQNKSRYKMKPGNGEHLTDLLSKTANRLMRLLK